MKRKRDEMKPDSDCQQLHRKNMKDKSLLTKKV